MATKKPVKRIKLDANKKKEITTSKKVAVSKVATKPKEKRKSPNIVRILTAPFRGIATYFKGSWNELRQVRWPNRKATWSLTLAVIIFTLFFVIIIVLLDTAFSYLFKEVLLK